MLDDTLKPWLIEVNFSPSLGGDSTTDQTVKEGLIEDVIDTLDIRAPAENANPAAAKSSLELDNNYVKEYERFLSRTPASHRDSALRSGGVGNFDVIFPFNDETHDAALKYSELDEPEVQQGRIVKAVEHKYGKYFAPTI